MLIVFTRSQSLGEKDVGDPLQDEHINEFLFLFIKFILPESPRATEAINFY